uniref:Uncharacterized protein n=1 Tax=Rhizophora mucronata TaxID=61149 RepID=A0A2P2QUL9_RHIMU
MQRSCSLHCSNCQGMLCKLLPFH